MNDKVSAIRSFGLTRIIKKIILHIGAKMPFLKMEFRSQIVKWGGVNILNPKNTLIGYEVFFDDLNPQDITIGERTIITSGTKVLSHFATGYCKEYILMKRGKVNIGSNVFIGMNVVIVKPVNIGNGAIIGANSVVVCDIPSNQIWGGNPAKFIKERGIN